MDKAENERAVIGGNNPPSPTLEERFAAMLADVDAIAAKGSALPIKVSSDEELGKYAEVVNAARRLKTGIDAQRKEENEPLRRAIEANNAFFNALVDRMARMIEVLGVRTDAYLNEKAVAERRRRAEEAARLQAEAEAKAREAAEANAGIESSIAENSAQRAGERAAYAASQAGGSNADMARTRTAGGTVTSRTELTFTVADYSKIDLRELRESFGVDAIDKAIRAHIKRHKKTKPLTGVEIFETSKASFRG